MVHDAERLKELQALDLNHKIMITQTRIIEWYEKFNGNVYISFSGGKDSTVLLHIARQLYPNIPAVFSNTGLEYYEIQKFAKQMGAKFIAPKIRFDEVVSTYGYPLISKEVSEAIYYARRICSQPVQVEREREREQNRSVAQTARTSWRKANALLGNRQIGNDWKFGGGESKPYHDRNSGEPKDDLAGPMGNGKTAREPTTDRAAAYAWGIRRRQEMQGLLRNEQANRQRRGEWADWRRGCL